MKKNLIIIALVCLLCFSIFIPINTSNNVLAEGSAFTEIENLISEYYLDDIDNVKDRTAGGTGEKNMALKLKNYCLTNSYSYFENLDGYEQNFALDTDKTSQNIIGVKNNGVGKYVILGAHYDSAYIENKSYGYSDNLSGVVAVMYTAKMLASCTNFDVIVAFWGAEETGCNGSDYFVQKLSAETKQKILLYINFDSVGVGDYLYYYTNDFASKYQTNVDTFFASTIVQKYSNQNFSTKSMLGINYTTLPLQSDNLSFLTNGINSLSFFAGNLNTANGFGFFETSGHARIMHSTDTKETIDSVFGTTHFVQNIESISTATVNFLNSSNFAVSDFEGNQVQAWAFNTWNLKFFGVALVGIGYVVFLVMYFIRYKKEPKKIQVTYYNKNSKKKQNKLKNK